MYQKRYQNYYYNFNTRDGLKQYKLRHLIKTAIMKRADIPIGLIQQNAKYKTPCRSAYEQYNLCLAGNMFDRGICQEDQDKVIQCQKDNGLHPPNEQILNRLRTGLQIAKKRRKQIENRLREQHEGGSSFMKSKKKEQKVQQMIQIAQTPNITVQTAQTIDD